MMTEERFEDLLAAYGARFTAWPEDQREEGRVLLAASDRLQALWAQETLLDDMLATVRAPVVPARLRESVIASAAGAGLRPRRSKIWTWLSGAGVAATACAGAAFGVLIAYQITEHVRADNVLYQASLTGADDSEVLQIEMASLNVAGF